MSGLPDLIVVALVFLGWLLGVLALTALAATVMVAGITPFLLTVGLFWTVSGLHHAVVRYRPAAVQLRPAASRAAESRPETLDGAARLRDADLFHGLSPQQMAAVAALGHPIRVGADTTLVRTTEPGATLYVVLQGRVELYARSEIGDVTMRVTGPSECFPIAALLGSGQLITSARSMVEAELYAIPASDLRDLCERDSEMGQEVYRNAAEIMAGRYRITADRMTRAAERALRGGDFWEAVRSWHKGAVAGAPKSGPQWWEALAGLPDDARRSEMRRLYEALAALDEPERSALLEEAIGGEFSLPDEAQVRVTTARLEAWLEMEPRAAQTIAAGYQRAARLLPASARLRELTAARTLATRMTPERRSRLEDLMAASLRS